MDTFQAPICHENWGTTVSATRRQFIDILLNLLRPHSTILYAACGTGQYWSLLLEHEHTIVGIAPSEEHGSNARTKYPNVRIERAGLQEMCYHEAFDGILCGDAIEMVFPEDGPLILGNFQRAIKFAGYLYFAVEIADELERENAFHTGRQLGLPILYGERVHAGSYFYSPRLDQIKAWIQHAGLTLVDEAEAEGQHHFLVRKYYGSSANMQALTMSGG